MELEEITTPSLDLPPLNSEFIPVQHAVKERERISSPRRSRSRSPINIRRPGDWDCKECKAMNYASRLYCFRCKAAKDDTLPKYEDSKASKDWICGNCDQNNFGTRKVCFVCKAHPSAYRPSVNNNDWECLECSGNNYSRRIDCYRCHAPKPSPHSSSYDSKYVGDWICPECSGNNYSKRVDCYRCAAPKPQDDWGRRSNPFRPQFGQSTTRSHPSREMPAGHKYAQDWLCPNPSCGGNNYSRRMDCYKCKTAKPEPSPEVRANSFIDQTEYINQTERPRPRPQKRGYAKIDGKWVTKEVLFAYREGKKEAARAELARKRGDWMCPGCGINNAPIRPDCIRCRKMKPGGAEGKYKNDWICEKCLGNNYSRRIDCYKCKEPKPET